MRPDELVRIESLLDEYEVEPMTPAATAWNHLVNYLQVPAHEAYTRSMVELCIDVVMSYGRRKASNEPTHMHHDATDD